MVREFEKLGLGYVLRDTEAIAELSVDNIVRSRGETKGFLTVYCGLPGTSSRDGHIHQAMFNLTSTSARTTAARALKDRAGGVDWTDLLEDLCRRVLTAEREGEPMVKVGGLPFDPKESYRLDPILPLNQVTIVYGDGGTGKSTLAVAMAVSVHEGLAIVEGWAPRRAPVLYLDWEAGQDAINKRVRGIALGAHVPEGRLVQIDYRDCRRRGPLYTFAEDISRDIDREGYGLVVVDSVEMASGILGEGDANEKAIRLFTAFGYLKTTVLAIDHVNKNDADTPTKTSRPYGSVFKRNLARSTYELRRSDASSVVGLYHTKVNDGARQAPVALHVAFGDDGSIVYSRQSELPPDLTGSLSKTEQIVQVLRAGHLSAREVAEALSEDGKATSQDVDRVRELMRKYPKRFGALPSGKWELIPDQPAAEGAR